MLTYGSLPPLVTHGNSDGVFFRIRNHASKRSEQYPLIRSTLGDRTLGHLWRQDEVASYVTMCRFDRNQIVMCDYPYPDVHTVPIDYNHMLSVANNNNGQCSKMDTIRCALQDSPNVEPLRD